MCVDVKTHNNDVYSFAKLIPHIVGEAFYTGEMENELRRIVRVGFRMFKDNDREGCMGMIEEFRRQAIYPHIYSVHISMQEER